MITLTTEADLHNFLQMAQYLSSLQENTKERIKEYVDVANDHYKKWLDEHHEHLICIDERDLLQKQVTTQKLLIEELNNRLSEVVRDADKANRASVEIINDLRQELAATIQERDIATRKLIDNDL